MYKQPETIPREIIDCIADNREPNPQELWRVAGHIWRDVAGRRREFGTERPHINRLSIQAARAALTGAIDRPR